jgi:hypothetical protein
VRFHRAIAERLTAFHDEASLADAAARRPDLVAALAPYGHLVWYLPEPTTAPITRFLGAALAAVDSTVIVGLTGAPDADTTVLDTCRRAGVDVSTTSVAAAEPLEGDALPPTASAIVSVSDADEEVRAVVRRIAELAEAGVPLDRIGVFFPTADPYVGMLEQQLGAAGMQANGPSRRRVSGSAAGRTLLAALALPSKRWRRDRVMALVSSAPIRQGTVGATPSSWEHVSRAAGVVQDIGDWRRKLPSHRTDLQQALKEVDAVEQPGRQAAIERELADLDRLEAFVEDLHAGVTAVERAIGWTAKAAAATKLLGSLLGTGGTHGSWPEREAAAFERVEEALTRLATLAELEAEPTHDTFVRALSSELDVSGGGTAGSARASRTARSPARQATTSTPCSCWGASRTCARHLAGTMPSCPTPRGRSPPARSSCARGDSVSSTGTSSPRSRRRRLIVAP